MITELFEPVLIILLPFAIVSCAIAVPLLVRARRSAALERTLPDVLKSIKKELDAGKALQTALRDVAKLRKDIWCEELERLNENLQTYELTKALAIFTEKCGSAKVAKIMSMINVGVKAGASVAELLGGVAEDLWVSYKLDIERDIKIRGYVLAILLGVLVLAPCVCAFVLTAFGASADLRMLMGVFLCAITSISTVTAGIFTEKPKLYISATPLFIFVAYVLYTVAYIVSKNVLRV